MPAATALLLLDMAAGGWLPRIVPFAAVAALRLRPSRWSGGWFLTMVPFAAAAALRLRPSRWSDGADAPPLRPGVALAHRANGGSVV